MQFLRADNILLIGFFLFTVFITHRVPLPVQLGVAGEKVARVLCDKDVHCASKVPLPLSTASTFAIDPHVHCEYKTELSRAQ